MTARWALTSKSVLALTAVCAVGLMSSAFLSVGGDVWERLTAPFAFGTIGLTVATAAVAIVYFVKIRLPLSRHLRGRLPMTDVEFIAASNLLNGVDPYVVQKMRWTINREFRLLGATRFRPEDDLEVDLHLSDLTFWGEWLEDVTADLGIQEAELARELELARIQTYADLVLMFDRLRRRSNAAKRQNVSAQSSA